MTLPSARVIAVNRALADCGLAMYTTLFGSAYPFSYDLGELAQYFIAYRRLISHWQKVAADQMITTSYEAFVSDPLAQGRRVAEHLGVAWSDAMVRIEDNPTGSATASAVQVRQPIHTGASGRWRRYRAQLSVLWDALEAAGIDPAHS